MEFSFSEEQKLIKDAARDFLVKECPSDLVREMEEDDKCYSSDLWRKMAGLGWLGLIFPVEYGGLGGSFLDLIVVLEEMGRYLVPVPFLPTIILGGLSLLLGGTEEQKQEFLPKIANGEVILTMAWTELDPDFHATGINMRAFRKGNGFLINGTKIFVPYANIADYLICATRTKESDKKEQGITLFLIERKNTRISYTPLKTIACDKQYEVSFNKVRMTYENVLGKYDEGWGVMKKVFDFTVIAQCALMIGGAERVLEIAVDHAKKRIQFGRPIGSFQAIQHRCANMMIDLEGAKFVTYEAAWKLSNGLPCSLEVSVGKAWVNQACQRICANGHQIIGGTGVVNDHDLQLYSRRAKAAEFLWGDTDFHREIVAQQLRL